VTDEPMCPRCGETRLLDALGRNWFVCIVCSHVFTWSPPKIDAPVGGSQ